MDELTTLTSGIAGLSIARNSVDISHNADQMRQYRNLVNDINFYLLGVIIPLGLFFNAFSIVVCSLSIGLRRTTTGHYLMALASADFLFLIGDLIRWLNQAVSEGSVQYRLNTNILHQSQFVCKVSYWLRYGAKLSSAWFTVAIIVERLITVALPLKVSLVSTSSRAKAIIALISLAGFGLGSFPVWTVGIDVIPPSKWSPVSSTIGSRTFDLENSVTVEPSFYSTDQQQQLVRQRRCIILQTEEAKTGYRNWSTVVLRIGTLALPGAIITVLTTIIVVVLVRAARWRRRNVERGQAAIVASSGRRRSSTPSPLLRVRLVHGQSSGCRLPLPRTFSANNNHTVTTTVTTATTPAANHGRRHHHSHSMPPQHQLTLMMVAVCAAFVCLRTPYTIAYYFYTYRAELFSQPGAGVSYRVELSSFTAWRITEIIATSNYVLNFFLYALCGSYFRQQVREAMSCVVCRRYGNRWRRWSPTSLIGHNGDVATHLDNSYPAKSRGSCSSTSTHLQRHSLGSDIKITPLRRYSAIEQTTTC